MRCQRCGKENPAEIHTCSPNQKHDEALLRQALEAMDDMATDSRLLDMSATRIHIFETARDALRERLK